MKKIKGCPWWLGGKESACQCRRRGFDPWSRKIPYVTEQLSLFTTTIEPVLCNPGAATTEPTCCSYWSPCTQTPMPHKRSRQNEKLLQPESSPQWPQLEKNQCSNKDPAHLLDHRKSKRIPEKHLLLLHWLYQSICVDHNKLWKILQEKGIPDHLTCLLRNLYSVQEAIVRTGHGTTNWFQTGKGVSQSYILSLCLFNLYAEYIMRNGRLDEAQAGIKITGRSINNLRYADDTLWQKVKN